MGGDRSLSAHVALTPRPYLKAGGDDTEKMSPLKRQLCKCQEGNASGSRGSEEAPPPH